MINLFITILLFNVLIIIFKFFNRYHVDNLQALIVNYLTAGTLGVLNSTQTITFEYVWNAPWLFHAMIVGSLFIIVFNLYATGTQKVGIAITTVANKMSLVIPVAIALAIYPNANITIWTVVAFILAILGIYLSSTKNGKLTFNKQYVWLILLVFVGQGIADSVFNYAQKNSIGNGESPAFFSVLFMMAALCGVMILIGRSFREKIKFSYKNIVGGIVLGIPNYGSLIYFFKALDSSGLHPSVVFPIVSMGVVVLSAIIGIVFYKETLSRSNWIGIVSSVLAIALITFM
ncbi:MAG: EamA/RhaT family transporter [Flavobacteriales bacterium]|jgi:drug/metabolite transporter (DMT)-like permease|nr:EamA/RhaT family transporter [Flavobacteriales bacterium]